MDITVLLTCIKLESLYCKTKIVLMGKEIMSNCVQAYFLIVQKCYYVIVHYMCDYPVRMPYCSEVGHVIIV